MEMLTDLEHQTGGIMMEDKSTTIRVKQSTKERLDAIGNIGQSYDDIINLVCNFFEDKMIYHLDD